MSHPFAVLAVAEGASAPAFMQFVPILLVFAIFYFLLIAPMRKRQKALQSLIESLKKGDRVVTNGGLYGTISDAKEHVVVLRIAENVKVEVVKSAIASVIDKKKE